MRDYIKKKLTLLNPMITELYFHTFCVTDCMFSDNDAVTWEMQTSTHYYIIYVIDTEVLIVFT